MAELTSMLSSVCQWFDSSAPQLSLPLLLQNNGTLNSSPVDHTSSLPAHSRSCRRSAPPALHRPLQFNCLDFHPIRGDKHLIKFFSFYLVLYSTFKLSFPQINSATTNLTFLLLSCGFFSVFLPLFPSDLSCCQLSFSTLCNMNSPGLHLLILLQHAPEGKLISFPTLSALQ